MKKKPLYQVIINDIKKDILVGTYKVEEQLPTELELSERYKVSRITSKRALVELENEGLIYRLRGKGSFVKATTKHNVVGKLTDILFVMPFPKDTGFGNYTQGVFKALEQTNYRLIVQTHENIVHQDLQELLSNYAGVIFYPLNNESDLEMLYSLYLNELPTVVLDKEYASIPFPTVVADNQQGGFEATTHLLEGGIMNIAFMTSQSVLEVSTIRERYLGYLKALHTAGNNHKKLYLMPNEMKLDEFADEIAKTLLSDGIQGVIAENDIVAIELINHLKQQGVAIPAEVSVVGFDNIQASELIEPRLTTIAQNFTEMGYIACQELLKQIEGQKVTKKTSVVPIEFIQRETTKKQIDSSF